MKKFIASMLTICMILATFSFTAFAQTGAVNENRGIKLYINTESVAEATDKMYATEYITVTVKLESADQIAHAEYALNYNSAYFTLVEKQSDVIGGFNEETENIIKHYCWTETGGYFTENEQILATYKFEAIAQPTEVFDYFKITDAIATNYDESIDSNRVNVATNEEKVTILLKDYKIEKYIGTTDGDSEKIDETEGEVTELSFPYDDKTHTFSIVTEPTSTVEYYIGNEKVPAIEIKKEGEYVIRYVVTDQEVGYAPVDKTFTIKIQKPEFFVEVGQEDYVDGMALVLVYTKTPNVYFSYENKDYEMVDVSDSGYLYDDPRTTDIEEVPYPYTYAYVVAPTANDTIDEYEANVIWWYTGDTDSIGSELKAVPVGDYDADINDDGDLTVDDIVVAFGIANTRESYFATDKHQYKILKLDHFKNKTIRGEDTGYVVTEVKKELRIN